MGDLRCAISNRLLPVPVYRRVAVQLVLGIPARRQLSTPVVEMEI